MKAFHLKIETYSQTIPSLAGVKRRTVEPQDIPEPENNKVHNPNLNTNHEPSIK